MARVQHLLRGLIALALALPLTAVTSAPASAQATITTAFTAGHTRNCAESWTRGFFTWYPDPTSGGRVVVAGTLVDDPVARCAEPEPGEAFATFSAYIRNTKVDEEQVFLDADQVDSGGRTRQFQFALAPISVTNPHIDRVEVQVCRTAGPMLPAHSCGTTAVFPRPYAITTN